jgi:redox-sensitive bicupin YhaK (pirin superfamily)
MIRLRPAAERGQFDHGWLKTFHSFSFGRYVDRRHMGFRALRVINEDYVQPGQGFGTHPHDNMEIITLVLSGALEHRDSMGNGSIIRPGELQRMSAGTGLAHSEFNPSKSELLHLYQIWLLPDREGYEPSYEQRSFDPADRDGRFQIVAAPDGRDGSLTIHQDAILALGRVEPGRELAYPLSPGRHAWVQVLTGGTLLSGVLLQAGDGAAVSEEKALSFHGQQTSDVLVFDLA